MVRMEIIQIELSLLYINYLYDFVGANSWVKMGEI